jgi:ankyrin repeat protein
MNQENNLSSLRKVESWLPVKVCAWCGFRPPEDALEVALHRWKFYAPICPECELFAEKLQANQRKLWRIIVAFCFGLASIPAYFIALDELVIGIIAWPIFGILVLGFLTFPLDLQWLSRLGVREEPPQGYASKGWHPCKSVGGGRVKFHNDAYHALFAALQPDRAAPHSFNPHKELRQMIESGDGEQIEAARDLITPEVVPTLVAWYWNAPDWGQKRAIVELLQDQSDSDLRGLMLDFLRVPLEPGDEQTELAQAIALTFIDEKYDRFSEYYNNRDLLARDVLSVLQANGLQAETPQPEPVQPPRPALSLSPAMPANERLLHGIAADDMPTVERALRDGADIESIVPSGDRKGVSALLFAVMIKRFEIARLLIDQGANIHFVRPDLDEQLVPNRGQTALWWAANHGNLPLVEELLRRGAAIDTPDHYGGTPLIQAADSGHLAVVRYLVERGANIHAALESYAMGFCDGRKAFHFAVSNGHLAVVEYLLDKGNQPDERSGYGFTPLMTAVDENFYALADLLIKRGADVNATNYGPGNYIGLRGYTPLVFAVKAGRVKMTKLLLQAGADPHYRVPAGQRWNGESLPESGLIDFVPAGKHSESLLALLKKHGL